MTDETALDELCRTAARLVHAGPTPPRRVRVQRGDLIVDVEWPVAGTSAPAPAPTPAAPPPAEDGAHVVRAPMVGTFYHAPEPGAKPFVAVGDLVEPGQQLGILESMKLMNPIEADCAGQIVEILVADGAPVEYDQPLVRMESHGGSACSTPS